MIKFIKNNKLLSFMIFISALIIIIGIICSSIFDDESRQLILSNINNIIDNIKNKNIYTFSNYIKCFSNNILFYIIIWIFGISIIGLPIVIFLYSTKLFLFTIEFMYLFINIKITGILFNIIYLIPDIINILVLFFITYYSVSYSVVLFRFLFRIRNYSIQKITKKYIKILLLCIIICFISSLIEIFIIPRILICLI